MSFYDKDLAYIHHHGFGDLARGAAPGLLDLLRHAGVREGLVVDLGCGSGLWARALVEAGYDVLGVDRSPAMIQLARTVAPLARFQEASIYEVELPRCAAVTAIGEGLSYWVNEDPRTELPDLCDRIFHALAPGGLLVFDMVMRSTGGPMGYHAEHEGDDWSIEVKVEERPGEYRLTRRISTVRDVDGKPRRAEELHRVRTFERSEIEQILRGAGFTVRVYRGYGEMPLVRQRLGFRARKPPR